MPSRCTYCAAGCKCGRQLMTEGTCLYCGHGNVAIEVGGSSKPRPLHLRLAEAVAMLAPDPPAPASVHPLRTWSAAEIITALRAWERDTGSMPKSVDWARRAPNRPCAQTVRNIFGTWPAAIEAATFNASDRLAHAA